MKKCAAVAVAILLVMNLSFSETAMGAFSEGHLVQLSEIHLQLEEARQARSENLEEIRRLLNQELVREQLGRLVDLEKVEVALATLDDDTLKELADRSKATNDQIEAGLSTSSWIIIAVAAFAVVAIIGWSASRKH